MEDSARGAFGSTQPLRTRARPPGGRPRAVLLILVGLLAGPAGAIPLDALREDAPRVYTVQEGDTLWEIAAKFLDSPWRWPELWDRNAYISNPDLIYPGDRLRLRLVDGQARLSRLREVRLSPRLEGAPVQRLEPISPVDRSLVLPNLDRYGLLGGSRRPGSLGGRLIAGARQRVMFATGNKVFARLGRKASSTALWYTFRRPQRITALGGERVLGYLLEHTGRVRIRGPAGRDGLFAGTVVRTYAPIEAGDRIYPGPSSTSRAQFHPRAAPAIQGRILRHVGEESMLGQGQMVVLNRGARNGLEQGHVLEVRGAPRRVRDPDGGEAVRLPGRRKGVIMVVRTAGRLSFALIIENTLPIKRGDRVAPPEG